MEQGGEMVAWVGLSVVLGMLSLAGIGELFANGLSFTVGGLFMTLILVVISGIFMQNAVAGARRIRIARRAKPGAEPLKAAQVAAGAQKGS